jgi:hypothetical protein
MTSLEKSSRPSKVSFWDLFTETFKTVFSANFWVLFGVSLIFSAIVFGIFSLFGMILFFSFASSFVDHFADSSFPIASFLVLAPLFPIALLVGFGINACQWTALIDANFHLARRKKLSFGEIMKKAFGNFWMKLRLTIRLFFSVFFVPALLFSPVLTFGFGAAFASVDDPSRISFHMGALPLLLLPFALLLFISLFRGTYRIFSFHFLVEGAKTAGDSIRESIAFVKGRFWKVFGFSAFMTLLLAIFSWFIHGLFSPSAFFQPFMHRFSEGTENGMMENGMMGGRLFEIDPNGFPVTAHMAQPFSLLSLVINSLGTLLFIAFITLFFLALKKEKHQ